MRELCVLLILLSFAIALPATWFVRSLGRRLGTLDGPGVTGQTKMAARKVPNTGGIAIVVAIVAPIAGALALAQSDHAVSLIVDRAPELARHIAGIRDQTGAGLALLACVLVLHVVGLVDDRRALGPYLKLAIMLGVGVAGVVFTNSRLLTLLDAHAGGAWLSIALTVVWIGVVTNAFNFLDNMDGLSAGVATICATFFLITSLVVTPPQWFVAGVFALVIGSLLGFLVFNFPWIQRNTGATRQGGASIFMGDGGSLVVGFLIALLSVRITYYAPGSAAAASGQHWLAIFTPLVILAVPLYDFCSVTLIRLSQGRSPFVGDLQHFSHRLVGHGLSQRDAVLVIYGATAVTGIGAVALPKLETWQGVLVGVQTALVLLVIALYEWSRDTPINHQRRI